MTRHMTTFCAAGLLVGMMAMPSQASLITIDDFTDGSVSLVIVNGSPVNPATMTEVGLTGVIDGERESMLLQVPATGVSSLIINNPDPEASYGQANAQGNAMLTYDGVGATGLGGGAGIDLTDGGTNDSLYIGLLEADAGVIFTYEVTDFGGLVATQSYTKPAPGHAAGSTLGIYFEFVNFVGMAVDFTKITKVKLTVSNVPGETTTDARFSLLGATTIVPEPSSLALLGMAVLPLGFTALKRRRQKKNAA